MGLEEKRPAREREQEQEESCKPYTRGWWTGEMKLNLQEPNTKQIIALPVNPPLPPSNVNLNSVPAP